MTINKKFMGKCHAHKPSKGKGHYNRKDPVDQLIEDIEFAIEALGLDYKVELISRGKVHDSTVQKMPE